MTQERDYYDYDVQVRDFTCIIDTLLMNNIIDTLLINIFLLKEININLSDIKCHYIPFLSHPPAPANVTTLGVTQIERFTFKKRLKKMKFRDQRKDFTPPPTPRPLIVKCV